VQSFNSYIVLTRIPTRLLVVGGIHLAVVWALINGLHVDAEPPCLCSNIVVDMIDAPPPPQDTFIPPEPKTTPVSFTPDPKVPPVPIDINTVSDLPVGATPSVFEEPRPVLSEPTPVVTGAAVDPRHPLTQPDYPMPSRRLDEQGKVALSVLVGTDGRVLEVKVTQSSGSPRLDQAAVNEARAHWRLRPATRNGVPFEQWLSLGVVFRLENR
jgi:protein TonB